MNDIVLSTIYDLSFVSFLMPFSQLVLKICTIRGLYYFWYMPKVATKTALTALMQGNIPKSVFFSGLFTFLMLLS